MIQRHIFATYINHIYPQPANQLSQPLKNFLDEPVFNLTSYRDLQLKSRDVSTDCPWFLQSWVYPKSEWNWTSMWWKELSKFCFSMKNSKTTITRSFHTLREKCSNTEFSLVHIFLYFDWLKKTLHLDTFHAVTVLEMTWCREI